MTRKSPYRHPVKGHMRAGRSVNPYERGKGGKPRTRSRPRRVVGNPVGNDPFSVSLFYPDAKTQSFSIDVDNMTDAARRGFDRTKVSAMPERIRIRVVDRR